MHKRLFLLLLSLLALKLEGYPQPERISQPLPFALYTVPKSGSHLLIKALHFMTGFSPAWHTGELPHLEAWYARDRFPYTHCCLSPDLLQYYASSPAKQILGVRDLRDVCVSIVYQILKGSWPEFTHSPQKQAAFRQMGFDQQLLYVINQEYEIDPPKIKNQLGMRKVAEQAVLLARDPHILVCRFEDLVGPQGGGSAQLQKRTLQKIAEHIGTPMSPAEIDGLAARLYGNEENPFGEGDFQNYQSTFREGKIGSWQEAFKPIHKEAFKKRLGWALIELGYERDSFW